MATSAMSLEVIMTWPHFPAAVTVFALADEAALIAALRELFVHGLHVAGKIILCPKPKGCAAMFAVGLVTFVRLLMALPMLTCRV